MRVTVIGEECIDEFVYGECKRLSPEAPIPIFTPLETIFNFGMAGNVIRNLHALDESLTISSIHQQEDIKKIRYVEKKSNHMLLRVDKEKEVEKLNLNISTSNLIHNSDIVIVSDYDKGLLSLELIEQIGKLSKLSILDSKKKLTKEVVNSFTFVKLNEQESENNSDLQNCSNIITTLGARGARYNGEVFESPSPKETVDVSGAGDTFTASFILEYYNTGDVIESIIFANRMASLVVSKRGVATP